MMWQNILPFLALVALIPYHVRAHTVFTTLFVDGVDQGDGVSIRMNMDPANALDYVWPISSDDMACGQ